MENKKYHYRTFLNEKAGAAMVEASLTDCSWEREGDRNVNYDGTLHISDCNRSIDLDLSFSSKEDARKVLRKLDRLQDAVDGLRNAVQRAMKQEFGGK